VNKLESSVGNKDRILSFADSWEDIDKEIFDELTENLIEIRKRNKRRDNE
jgi:hypothetical protein